MSTSTSSADPHGQTRAADDLWFGKDLSNSPPIPEQAIERAVALMRSIKHALDPAGTLAPGRYGIS